MPTPAVDWLSTDELLAAFHPLNPNEHDELDVERTARSLLDAGWVEPITLNRLNRIIVGGHGRVMAADWLRQQSQAWFDHQYQRWEQVYAALEDDRLRFSPDWWQKCLVLEVELDDRTHEAMLMRLNDTESQGVDDPQKLRSLLSSLPALSRSLAGHEAPAEPAPGAEFPQSSVEAATDYQDKQHFERSDATDYRVKDAPEPDTAEHFSGDVTTYEGEPDEDWQPELEEDEERQGKPAKTPPPVRAIAVSLTWSEWKKWNAWKKAQGIARDTDAAVHHAAFTEEG